MAVWKIILLSILTAVVLGSVGGVLIGKYLVKRAKSNKKPVLSRKERILYLACIALGTASILFGVFYKSPEPGNSMNLENPAFTENGAAMLPEQGGGTAVAVEVME